MSKYYEISSVVDAIQWNGDNINQIREFISDVKIGVGNVAIKQDKNNLHFAYDDEGFGGPERKNLVFLKGEFICVHQKVVYQMVERFFRSLYAPTDT